MKSSATSRYNNGRLRCGLVNIQFYFTDVGEDEGGIIFVPGQHKHLRTKTSPKRFFVALGSHKANMPPHEGFGMLELDDEAVYHPTVSAGDMILFVRSTLPASCTALPG